MAGGVGAGEEVGLPTLAPQVVQVNGVGATSRAVAYGACQCDEGDCYLCMHDLHR